MLRETSRLLLLSAAAVGMNASGSAVAQTPTVDEWQTPSSFVPPILAGESPQVATGCLALAISYEAGLEPEVGQEAVAQVILNRVRHPAYPDTVCGVVWQGSARRTGCQFTFTCDGSLRRARIAQATIAAQRVAARVLAGQSVDHVHGATHYHARYVSPYWAPSLTRVRQIATHIFYRSSGGSIRIEDRPVMAPPYPHKDASAPVSEDPVIRNGEFAPWGLAVGSPRR